MTILYVFDRGAEMFVVFRYNGRVYERPCKSIANDRIVFRFRGEEVRPDIVFHRIYD